VKRREFITLLGCAAAWPLGARAQQGERIRRIGVLMGLAETDPFTIGYVRELRDALKQLGWTDSQNIQFTYRYAAGDPSRARAFAKELVEMQPGFDRWSHNPCGCRAFAGDPHGACRICLDYRSRPRRFRCQYGAARR
jgi:hypothetical protein